MKDIQEQLIQDLESIQNINVYNFLPSGKVEDEIIVIINEVENRPGKFGDGKEVQSEIIYNIDIYSKERNTYYIRMLINEKLVESGWIRISGGTETRIDNYYYRPMLYNIFL